LQILELRGNWVLRAKDLARTAPPITTTCTTSARMPLAKRGSKTGLGKKGLAGDRGMDCMMARASSPTNVAALQEHLSAGPLRYAPCHRRARQSRLLQRSGI
jgi:hypothetical protein